MILQTLDEMAVMTGLLVGEAAGEDLVGKIAVACVIKNRRLDKRWPDDWIGVMLQAYQFSCFNGIPLHEPMDPVACERLFRPWRPDPWWKECKFVAYGAINSYFRDITKGANHYHAYYIERPRWAIEAKVCYRHGKHIFYRL